MGLGAMLVDSIDETELPKATSQRYMTAENASALLRTDGEDRTERKFLVHQKRSLQRKSCV